MIEVLVTVVILCIGLLGLAGLQVRLQTSEMEAYQRSQALILLDDMAHKISANRNFASSYVTNNPLGTGAANCAVAGTRQAQDSCEWNNALLGAAEKDSNNNKIGAMVNARGCVESLGNNTYMITVAWQGLTPLAAPPSSVSCGQNLYDSGATCTSDKCRRVLTTTVRIAVL